MNRLAACAVVLICVAPLACKSASNPPPAPPPPLAPLTCDIPPVCQRYTGKIPVSKLATLPAGKECIVVSTKDAAAVVWEGDNDVKTLMIGWNQKSSKYVCDPQQKAPTCTSKTCTFDLPLGTGNLCLCYGVGVVDNNDKSAMNDPRLIIQR